MSLDAHESETLMAYPLDTAAATDLVTKADLEAAVLTLEVRLVKWAIGIGLAIAGLLFAALRFTGG